MSANVAINSAIETISSADIVDYAKRSTIRRSNNVNDNGHVQSQHRLDGRALGVLSDHLLQDIGLERADVETQPTRISWYPEGQDFKPSLI